MALIGVSNTMISFSVMRKRHAYLYIQCMVFYLIPLRMWAEVPQKVVRITVVSSSNDNLLKAVIFHL